MLIRKTHLSGDSIPSSQITPMELFQNGRPESTRRAFLARGGAMAAGAALAGTLPARAFADDKLETVEGAPQFQTRENQTPFSKATTYNNFYEFGTEKSGPRAQRAHPAHAPLDGAGRRPRQKAAHRQYRRPHPLSPARKPHLPPPLRRGLVDGHPLGRLFALRVHQLLRAAAQRQVRAVHLQDR